VVFTHSVVIRNAGRRAAHNVRVGHRTLPDFNVYPSIVYSVANLPGGGAEIVFPTLVGKEQVSISYIYSPPLTYNAINTHVKSDEGLAKVLEVLPTPQAARWLVRTISVLLAVGVIASIYVAHQFLGLALR